MSINIRDIVYEKLPYLINPADNAMLDSEILQSKYIMQPYLKKQDSEVEDDLNYTNQERLLIAYYTAYNANNRKLLINMAGQNGNAPTLPRLIKKAKADVVETEFESPNSENSFILSVEKIASELKALVCQTARTLGIRLPMCNADNLKKTIAIGLKKYS